MNLYEKILNLSPSVDEKFSQIKAEDLHRYVIEYPVVKTHPRGEKLDEYQLAVCSLGECAFSDESIYIVDEGLKGINFLEDFLSDKKTFFLKPLEAETKTVSFVKNFIKENNLDSHSEVVGIGGGLVLNVVAYVGESLDANLTYVPTSIIAMSDSVIGGKVRVNSIEGGVFRKHAHKSYYEPNFIFLEPRFLETFPKNLVSLNLAEVVKHGVYQSRALLEYISSDNFNQQNTDDLLKVILWTAELKRICLGVDPNETDDGADMVLRAGHTISDKLEEGSGLTMLHGESVTRGVYQQAKSENHANFDLLLKVYEKLGLMEYTK